VGKVLTLFQVDGRRREGLVLASIIVIIREVIGGSSSGNWRNPDRDFL